MKLNNNENAQILSRESAFNVDSIAELCAGMTLNKLESSVATSLTTSMMNSSSALPVHVDSKKILPTANPAKERINFGVDCDGQSLIVNSNSVSENRPQLLNAGFAYRKQCNGISGSSNNKMHSNSTKRPRNRNQANRGWSLQNGWSDGHGQSVSKTGRLTEPRTNADVAYSHRNNMRWPASSEKRINSRDAQKQNLEERKSVKVLQRPSSVTKNLGHNDAEFANQRDAAAAAHQKKGRKKTLSLNPDELEDLEILIEQIVKGGIDDANTDSDDDDDDDETLLKCNASEHCRTFPKNHEAFRNSDEDERGARMNTVKNSVIRNEPSAKGRRFLKETGKNTGHDRDRGRKMEISKTSDNHQPGSFQPCSRIIEISQPLSTAMEDNRAKQTMANVYAAQLKVALKHMDALPPRFQRRLQTGMNQIGGSDPALSKLMDGMLQPKENRAPSSSFACRDGERSREVRERGPKKSIRNLLNDLALYDEETALPDSFTRKLSYSLGALCEPEKPNDLSMSKLTSSSDPFQFRPPPIFPQRPLDQMFMMNGPYISNPLVVDSSFGYGKDFTPWHPDRMAMASPIPGTQETTFAVNAPELLPSSTINGNTSGRHHEISGSVEGNALLGITSDDSQMVFNQPLPPSMTKYQNNILQPEHVTGYHPTQFPMIPRIPVTANRNMAFGPMAPATNFSSCQSLDGMSTMPYVSDPMSYDASGRGYVPQAQVFMPPMSDRQYSNAVSMQVSDHVSTTAITNDLTPVQWYAHSIMLLPIVSILEN